MTTTDGAQDPVGVLLGHLGLPEEQDDGGLARLVEALRDVQDRVIGTEAPADVVAAVADLLESAARALEPYRLDTGSPPSWDDLRRMSGSRTLAPALEDLVCSADHLTAAVTFTPFYTGGNAAVHGGALPLVFDEVLGRLANVGRPMARTANLSVDYRQVTPVGVRLTLEARVVRQEGRKRYLEGSIRHGDRVTAEVHGLFVELRPDQP